MTALNSTTFGRAGEDAARAFLKRAGYKVLARNYASGGGELDIIAYKRGILVFAEVKTRSGVSYGAPAESVGEGKIYRLRGASAAFVREHCPGGRIEIRGFLGIHRRAKYKSTRNDIIEVYLDRQSLKPGRINHIEDAF